MITPSDILKKAENKVPEVLLAWLEQKEIFPLVLRSDKSLIAPTFEALNSELRELLQASKEKKGYGYRVQLKEVNTRKLGNQKLPESIVFEEVADFWKYIRKEKQWESFKDDIALIRGEHSQLESWLRMNPLKVIKHAGKWDGLLQVCRWFIAHPQPNCYLREVGGQPHTKFIEENKGIVESLLTVLIGEFIFKEGSTFEERFHLKTYERFLHIRLLDPTLSVYFNGISHIGITIPDLARLPLPCKKVIIMENKANYSNVENFLTLPQLTNTLVIFGSGYSVNDLGQITWLCEKEIYYWGDIDEHGFRILHLLRTHYPHTKSFLMDIETYNTFEHLAGSTLPAPLGALNLESSEQEMLEVLQATPSKNRLEQERIPQQYVIEKVKQLLTRL